MKKVPNYRNFEVCLNALFQSCIADSDTHLVSFAHNENEGEQCLKYDLHSKSVDSFRWFYNEFVSRLKNIAEHSNGAIRFCHVEAAGLDSATALYNICSCLPGYTAFIMCEDMYIGFSLYDVTDDEVVFFFELPHFYHDEEGEFVNAFCSAFGSPILQSQDCDEAVYSNTDWCWGERFVISKDGIAYTGK